MRLKNHGRSISNIEVAQISSHGLWLLVNGVEYFLPFKDFPWFKDATVYQICCVSLIGENHLYWHDLDIDLEIDSLQNIEKYPLIYKE